MEGEQVSLAAMEVLIPGLPISLILVQDGSLAFAVTAPFLPFYDNGACFDMEHLWFGGRAYNYHTRYLYKQLPDMLQWLQAQKLTWE